MEDTVEQSAEETVDSQDEAQEYAPGELAPCIVTQAKVWKSDDLKREGLLEPLKALIASLPGNNDLARRFAVLETWKARLFDRGHQHNVSDGEGFRVASAPDSDRRNSLAAMDDAGIVNVNVYSAQGDIATGVLNRGKVSVSFSPRRSKRPQDAASSDQAQNYVSIWEKNNPDLQRDITGLAWTDCRSLIWTRTIADKRFGLDDEGKPRQMEVSSAFGVLESRLSSMVDKLEESGYAQIFDDCDYALQRACFPWMGKKIRPGLASNVDDDFEKIARISTRTGIGSRFGADATCRETTMCYTWLKPGMFFGDACKDEDRDALLKNFPDGVFVIGAGKDICAAWEEDMSAHLASAMFTRGKGQNRRALGSSDVGIQQRVNTYAELFDIFCRSAIPTTLIDSSAIDPDAIASLEASPRRYFPVAPDTAAGQTIASIVGQTPTSTPQPAMMDLFNAYTGPLLQAIDGAAPALFGGGDGADTVGATQIRLAQALQRFGPCWLVVNSVIAKAAEQAARLFGKNAESDIEESIDGEDISVNPQALRGGEFTCIASTAGEIPESGAQIAAKVTQLMEMASSNQTIANILTSPSNAREIVRVLHIDHIIDVDEADSEDKQLAELEFLLDQPPLINPAYSQLETQIQQLNDIHESAKQAMVPLIQSGEQPNPEVIEKGKAMEQQLQQLQTQLQGTPQWTTSVPVATDASENHDVEAATLFSWMQKSDGRGMRLKSSRETPGASMQESPNWNRWMNVWLHWNDHIQQSAKQQKQAPVQPKVNLTGKLTPEQQAQALSMASGIQSSPAQSDIEQVQRIYTGTSETETRIKKTASS